VKQIFRDQIEESATFALVYSGQLRKKLAVHESGFFETEGIGQGTWQEFVQIADRFGVYVDTAPSLRLIEITSLVAGPTHRVAGVPSSQFDTPSIEFSIGTPEDLRQGVLFIEDRGLRKEATHRFENPPIAGLIGRSAPWQTPDSRDRWVDSRDIQEVVDQIAIEQMARIEQANTQIFPPEHIGPPPRGLKITYPQFLDPQVKESIEIERIYPVPYFLSVTRWDEM
jgi:hypothetical protein